MLCAVNFFYAAPCRSDSLPSPSAFPGKAPVDFLFQQYLAIDDGHLNAHRSLNEPFLITRQILHHHRISCKPKG